MKPFEDYQHNYQQNYNVGQHVPDRLRGPDEAMFTDFSSYLKGGQLPVIPRQLVISGLKFAILL